MYELEINDLLLIDGGTNWAKVIGGAAGVAGGVITAAGTAWTGAGIFAGGTMAVSSVGLIVRGFEDD